MTKDKSLGITLRQRACRYAGSCQKKSLTSFCMVKIVHCPGYIVHKSKDPVQLWWLPCNIASDLISVHLLFKRLENDQCTTFGLHIYLDVLQSKFLVFTILCGFMCIQHHIYVNLQQGSCKKFTIYIWIFFFKCTRLWVNLLMKLDVCPAHM